MSKLMENWKFFDGNEGCRAHWEMGVNVGCLRISFFIVEDKEQGVFEATIWTNIESNTDNFWFDKNGLSSLEEARNWCYDRFNEKLVIFKQEVVKVDKIIY